MPSKSPKQKRTMAAIAHGWKPTGTAKGIPKKVAEEFHRADRKNTGHRLTGRNQ